MALQRLPTVESEHNIKTIRHGCKDFFLSSGLRSRVVTWKAVPGGSCQSLNGFDRHGPERFSQLTAPVFGFLARDMRFFRLRFLRS
jgi:hypothetical protein